MGESPTHNRRIRPWWAAFAALLLAAVAVAQTPDTSANLGNAPASLRAGEGYRFDLSPTLGVLRDTARALTPAEAWAEAQRNTFKPLNGEPPNFGFTREALWFHTVVENRDHPARRWVLVIEQPRLDKVQLWLRSRGKEELTRELGDSARFETRSFPHRFPNYEFELGAGESVEILMRVESTSSIQVPTILYTPNELFRSTHDEQSAIGLYFGILLALLLYNLAVMIALREPSYLYYVVYLAAFGLLMLSFDGIGFQYLWPNSPWWQNASMPLGLGMMVATTAAFTRSFLELRQRMPWISRVVDLFVALSLVLAIGGLTPWRYEAAVALNAAVLVGATLVTLCAVTMTLRRQRAALLFLVAWSALIVFGVSYPLSSFNILPRAQTHEFGLMFGSAIEFLLLSFALSYRRHLQLADSEREARAAREALERTLVERNQELTQSATQLEELNRLLRDISLRDGLTGLYNRRFLDQLLVEAWNASLSRAEPVAVMMVDLDHFKNINDRYGHAAGDDCLRVVAARMSRQASTLGAVAARYGGEEFAVVLTGKPREIAEALAELMRSAVASEAVKTSGGAIPVTISVGLAFAVPKVEDSLGTLIKRADQALYEAKRRGRNRVVLA